MSFWNMSIDEITDMIKSYERNQRKDLKQKIILDSVLADQITKKVSKIFDAKNEIELLQLWDYFPSLFENEKNQFEKQKEIDEFEKFKSDRRVFAMRHNAKRGVE